MAKLKTDTPADLARMVHADLLRRRIKPPALAILSQIFETLFFVSLQTEEAEPLTCSITYLDSRSPDPDPPLRIMSSRWKCTRLQRPVTFNVANLAKMAKAADPAATSLAVYSDSRGRPYIWGLIDQVPVHYARMVTRESEWGPEIPGVFQAVITGIAEVLVLHEYAPIGTLRQSAIISKYHNVLYTGPVFATLLPYVKNYARGVESSLEKEVLRESVDMKGQLADSWLGTISRILLAVQRYGCGGAVLIVPNGPTDDLKVKYELRYTRLSETLKRYALSVMREHYSWRKAHEQAKEGAVKDGLYFAERVQEAAKRDCQAALAGCIRFIASLSRIDGLVLMSSELNVLGFGTEILTETDVPRFYAVSGVHATPRQLQKRDPKHFGMRHRSMMRYCAANPRSIGFVISQDGYVRAVMQHRRRVLMWDNIQLQVSFDRDPEDKTTRARESKPRLK